MTEIDTLVGDLLDQQAAAESDIPQIVQTYVDAIPVSSIDVDYTYQRELDRKRVAKMVAEYDPSLIGVIEVSKRADDTYRVIDGQHRLFVVRAAHQLGTKAHIACNVHTGLTPEQEAQLFFDIDSKRRRLTGWDRWNARRGAGEQIVMDIERLAREHGLTIDPAPRERHLRCVGACEKLVDLAGLDVLDETLRLAVAAYAGVPDSLRAEIVHGTGLVLAYYPTEVDRPRLLAAMQSIAPRQLSARAAALREVHTAQLPRLAAHVIVERYNAEPGPKIQDFLKRVAAGSRTTPAKSGGGSSK